MESREGKTGFAFAELVIIRPFLRREGESVITTFKELE
jgi:hypothetical protein